MVASDIYLYLLIVLGMLILVHFKNYIRTVYLALTLPGPPALPFLGNVLLINNGDKLEAFANNFYKWYGPIMRCWVSVIPYMIVTEPEHLQIILSSNSVSEKNSLYTLVHNIIGDGLITNNGIRWKKNRKLIQPYFNINILKQFVEIFAENTTELLEKLKDKNDVNITKYVNKYVLNVMQESILGLSKNEENGELPFRKGSMLATYRACRPWLLLHSIFKFTKLHEGELNQKLSLVNCTKKILEEKRKSIPTTSPISLIEMFNEISKNHPEFTDEDVVNETCTFMLAGQDSVGGTIGFSLYFLAKYPDIQDKVMQELDVIFDGDKRKPTFEDAQRMKYLEQCVKESLRICPSVPLLARRLKEEIALGKIVLPEGTNIFISPLLTHRLPHVYPDPLKFDPDRFSAENAEKMHPYAFLPFSAGPRNCIGYKFGLLETKIVICEILRNYRISLVPGDGDLKISYSVSLRARGGIWLRLEKRE